MVPNFKIGLDYGGTKIEGILLNEAGKQIVRKRYSYKKDYKSGIDTIKKLVNEFDKISGNICPVGIGIPGFSSKDTGLVTNANSLWLNDKPFKKDLETSLNRNVKFLNGPFYNMIFKIIEVQKNRLKIVLQSKKTTLNKEEYLFTAI